MYPFGLYLPSYITFLKQHDIGKKKDNLLEDSFNYEVDIIGKSRGFSKADSLSMYNVRMYGSCNHKPKEAKKKYDK